MPSLAYNRILLDYLYVTYIIHAGNIGKYKYQRNFIYI